MPGRIKLSAAGYAKNEKSHLEAMFLQFWESRVAEIALRPVTQHRFAAPVRQWRFDFAWPEQRVAVEISGGSFGRIVTCNHCGQRVFRISKKNGRKVYVVEPMHHQTAQGLADDHEKANAATILGWRVLSYTTGDLNRRLDQVVAEVEKLVRYMAAIKTGAPRQGGLFTGD